MDIKNKTILILGGWGLVGSAIARQIINEQPAKIVLCSLLENEAEEICTSLRDEFPHFQKENIIPWWGNIFVRYDYKDKSRGEVIESPEMRNRIITDVFHELDDDILHNSSIYKLFDEHKPEVVVDSINTATGIAYQDQYTAYRNAKRALDSGDIDEIKNKVEKMMASMSIPQLIRHVQILYNSMLNSKTKIYIKIGTSGTGGMGLNIPYTHSEEKPSRVLLTKSSVAGAQTLLLFLMGRTPDAPIIKEVKPTAAIAWKRIVFGEIKKGGKPVELFDCPIDKGIKLGDSFKFDEIPDLQKLNQNLKAVYIDTGENGIFSRGEFDAISSQGQMEYVTPEEIAQNVIYEIRGGNTGHDIINALDNATLEPTYRAGFMHTAAINKMKRLEKEHKMDSVAFEMLGPPRLSKLLFEAQILKLLYGSVKETVNIHPRYISENSVRLIQSNKLLRSEIISIGIPILMPDGKTLLRGKNVKIPPSTGDNAINLDAAKIDQWTHQGWVDLREKNFAKWIERFNTLMKTTLSVPEIDTSSRYLRDRDYWENFENIDIGKLVGWIFIYEEKGIRQKS